MKRFFRIKKKIYRKYLGDVWGEVILKGQKTRTFKFLLEIYRIKQVKSLFFRKKTAIKIRKAYFYRKKIALKNYNPNRVFLPFAPFERNRAYFTNSSTDKNTSYWKEQFWRHFKYIYKFNSVPTIKKKTFRINYLPILKLATKHKLAAINKLRRIIQSGKKVDFYKRVKKPLGYSDEKHREYIESKRRLYNHISWLQVKHSWWKRKITNWWYLRMTERRAAIFYGVFNLKKFRYIQNLSQKAMSLQVFHALRLEMMLNMVLFKLNIFRNIYFSNNFIRVKGILLNNKKIFYPFKSIVKGDIVSFSKSCFKKIFNLFTLKMYHNKSLILKKARKVTNWQKVEKYFLVNFLRNPRVAINKPAYFIVNYKILHAVLWRFPKRFEISGQYVFPGSTTYDWNFATQVAYN